MKKEKLSVGFVLKGIKTEQFAVLEENYSPKKETGLGTELLFKIDQTNKQIAVSIGVEFIQTKQVFLKIQVSCHFQIEEKSWKEFVKPKTKELIIPKGFLAHLSMITTGTARGILFAKTESTPFSIFIIPIINITEMIKEDGKFELIEK